MIELVAEGGYCAVTVRRLARAAGVSTHTFYERFEGKEECFASTCELVVGRIARRVLSSRGTGRDWHEQAELTFRAVTREIARESKGAQLVLVDAFGAGPPAVARMRRANAALETAVADGFASAPGRTGAPPLVVKGIVAGVTRVACTRLLAGRPEELPALGDELARWALSLRGESLSALGPCGRRAALGSPAGETPASKGSRDGRRAALGDERALIVAATTRLATDDGYGRLSVPGIRAAAGVSRKAVDAHFQNVTECFLAALETLIRNAIAYAISEGTKADSWPAGLYRALVAFCAHVEHDPAFAKLGFIEVFGPGIPGVRFRAWLIAGVADRLRRSAPARQRPTELAAEASIGAALGIIHHRIATGRLDRLSQTAPTLAFLMLAPAIGAPAAVEAIRAELERSSLHS
jgi:AcrR family transcriptional regulator